LLIRQSEGVSIRSLVIAVAIYTLGALGNANPLSAQVWLGGGATFPVSDYADYANTGFMLTGGMGYPLGDGGLSLTAEGFYGHNGRSDIDGDKTSPYGVMGGAEYDFGGPDSESGMYSFGALGIVWHKFSSDTVEDSTDSGLGLEVGVGYFFPFGRIGGWVEGRVVHANIDDETTTFTFAGVLAGISIPLGG
jgi:hypothetical protein